MVQVAAAKGSSSILILRHGLKFEARQELATGVFVTPDVPLISQNDLETSTLSKRERLAIDGMLPLANFALEVTLEEGGKALANKAWSSLWDFHLLSVCCGSPGFPLVSASQGRCSAFAIANRNLIINELTQVRTVTKNQVTWAAFNRSRFFSLIKDDRSSAAMRYFGNSHYLFDLDSRIMLLWAGIEGLLNIDSEHSRRISQYAAVLHDRSQPDKIAYAAKVRKAYGLRSRVVHGSKPKIDELEKGYEEASEILVRLIAKCVTLGRVPTRKELDTIAGTQSIM